MMSFVQRAYLNSIALFVFVLAFLFLFVFVISENRIKITLHIMVPYLSSPKPIGGKLKVAKAFKLLPAESSVAVQVTRGN